MTRAEVTFLLPYFISLTLSLGVLAYSWKRRAVRGATAFVWYTIGQSLWIASLIFELITPNLNGKLAWGGVEWIASILVVVALPAFVVQYTETNFRKPQILFILTLVVPVTMIALLATNRFHSLIHPNPRPVTGYPFIELQYDYSLAAYAFVVYCSILIGFSLFLLIRHSGRSHKIYQTQSLIIAIGIAVPLLGAIFTLIRFRFGALAEITPFTFALGNILIAWGLYRHRFLEIVPFGRDKVFEAMVEPVVILDNQHRVVDINTSMLDLLGQSAVDVVGKSAKEVFVDFPIPIKLYTHVSYARAETTFQIGSRNVHYEMTVWPLYDANRKMTGRIYISHDITALKELEGELRNLNQRLEQRVHERTRELAEAYDTTLEGWARALELRDKETEGHSRRVVTITLLLARAIDLPEDEIIHLRRGAILHDIGKIAIPDEILRKKGGLTEEERAIIRVHPETAYQLLSQVPYLKKALDIPYCHHERWDGNGYPRGLKGREIPLAARIFAIADVWDALSFDRPYNKAWSREKILAYFMEESSKQFDPRLVEVFLMMVEKGEI